MRSIGASPMDFGEWFCQNRMLGDSILTALNKMKQTDQQQQEFYAMTPKDSESVGWYVVRLDMAAGKVQLQSQEALGGTAEEWEDFWSIASFEV